MTIDGEYCGPTIARKLFSAPGFVVNFISKQSCMKNTLLSLEKPTSRLHVFASVAKQSIFKELIGKDGLLRRYAPRKDGACSNSLAKMDCFVATLLAKTGPAVIAWQRWIASSLCSSQRRGLAVRSKKLSDLPPKCG